MDYSRDRPRGADIVVEALERLGVRRIFTLSGNHIMPIFDALLGTNIAVVHVRQEAACVHMADAWGRLTGEVGVALVTGGQGQTNGAAALFTALAAESPVLLLSGHAGLSEIGRGAFQELAQADIARPMTKASWTAASVDTLADDIARSMRIAREGRPGPVHLSLPVDLLEAPAAAAPSIPLDASIRVGEPGADLIAAVAAELGRARRPLILCGPAACGAEGRGRMAALESASGIPVLGMESPRGLNDPSLGAFAEVLTQADCLVLLGKPLDFTLKFGDASAVAPACRFVVIDPDPALVARVDPARLAVSGAADALSTLEALARRLGDEPRPDWHATVRAAVDYRPPDWDDRRGSEGRLHPVELCRGVAAFLDRHPGGTLICDGGEIGQWPQALVNAPRRLINGVSGTIGASLPFALAARLHNPAGPVVAVLGDGTFGFHMAEFDTAVRYGLPFIAVVGNDARWNAEYQIQLRQYGAARARHCDLLSSRYDRVATALGGYGALVTRAEDLPQALEDAHASGLPACLNVLIESVPAPVIRRPKAG
ncbi:thiamine pyrophosphate-binding protein [Methylobacterium sp. E-041]|uniref:thiamine pyrophosphate-binding protein n=1 Tax=unclassified Methylobacterium TaxID=2615210 RepID=UPI001FBA4EC3|nr:MULTISPECIES: thiamine pyrophosphate-binding protein [unclassified Methylobacterium]MCJ2037629.1 thiamine pyrophosphate-binding protein [Methylobacterium sp. J-059]MCJ2105379.1 thiamine pyrophosphate-binding protein [Methylobacterium sp. E-041]